MKYSFDRLTLHYQLVSDWSPPNGALGAPQRIESVIAQRGWAAGTLICSEQSLRAQFGFGHRVAREAIRILQSRDAVQARRGSQGGLLGGTPSRAMAIGALADYLGAIAV